ncbi:MAG: hypothetical protein WCK49_05900 [Myxococcaceae bacterium]
MHSEIRKVGNSKGIIFPKAIIEQCHFEDTVDIKVVDGGLMITPVHKKRSGWEQAFKNAEPENDTLSQEWQSFQNASDDEEWVW